MNKLNLFYGILSLVIGLSLFTPTIVPQAILSLLFIGSGAHLLKKTFKDGK